MTLSLLVFTLVSEADIFLNCLYLKAKSCYRYKP